MSPNEREEQFQVWLIHMDDAIEAFSKYLPQDVSAKLDYSPESLDALEGWLLNRYSTKEDLKLDSENVIFDGAIRYLGETFRKTLGGRWFINARDRDLLFFGIPQLENMRGQEVPFSPVTTVTACFSRATGNYFRTILTNLQSKS